MDETAIGAFCRAWMAHVAGVQEADEQGKKLKDAIFDHSHPGVRALAGNPLLLTILAQVYWTNANRSLPTRRASLFDSAVEALYDQRRDKWKQAGISQIRLTQALGAVAAHIHANERTGFVEEGTVRAQLWNILSDWDQVEVVLEATREVSGFLVARGEGVYGFLHRAVQEYFAAKHLTNDPSQLCARLTERLLDPTWREPIILAAGIVSQTRYPNRTRYLAEVFATLLDTPDPAGDFLPRRELLAVAACTECERVPPQASQRIAERLLALYARREGGRRSPVLRKRILEAFILLQEYENRAQTEKALCQALLSLDFELRYAAMDMIIETKWDSESVAQTLVKTWMDDAGPAVSLLTALDEMIKRSPSCFKAEFLPLRQAVTNDPCLWEKASIDRSWKAVFRVLYLPLGAYFQPDRINRDSSLTPLLLDLLQRPKPSDPLVLEELRHRLIPLASVPGSAEARDAALALSALGDGSWIQSCIEHADNQGHQLHPIVACLVLALSLELALDPDRGLSNDFECALQEAVGLTRTFVQLSDRIVDCRQSFQKIKTRIQAVEPRVSEEIAQVNAYISNFIDEAAFVSTEAYQKATKLKKDLELANEHLHEHRSASAIAFDANLAAKTKDVHKLSLLLEDVQIIQSRINTDRKVLNTAISPNKIRSARDQIREREKELAPKCNLINALASDLGIFLPLDIDQAHTLATNFLDGQLSRIQKFKLIQGLQQKPGNLELREMVKELMAILGSAFPLDTKGLRNAFDILNHVISHVLLNADSVQSEDALLLQRNLTSLSDLLANYIEAFENAGGALDSQLEDKFIKYPERFFSRMTQIKSSAYALGIMLPMDWKQAQNLVYKRIGELEQDLQDVAVGRELRATLNHIANLKQRRIDELTLSRTSSDPVLGTEAHGRAKAYEDELLPANKQARSHAAIPGFVLPFDIDSSLEYVKAQERKLSHTYSHALNYTRVLEIEFTRTLTRAQNLLNDFELAASQELPTRRPTGKLSASKKFTLTQELIELRTLTLSSEIDLVSVRRLDLTPDLNFAFKLARPSAHVNEIIRSINERLDRIDADSEVKQLLEMGLVSAQNVQKSFATFIPIAQVMSTFIDIYMNRWPVEAERLTNVPELRKLNQNTIKELIDDLASSNDERRQQAKKILVARRYASELGRETIEQIADLIDRYTHDAQVTAHLIKRHTSGSGREVSDQMAKGIDRCAHDAQVANQLRWTLEEATTYDEPTWVNEWIEQMRTPSSKKEAQTILASIHHITAKTGETFLDALQVDGPQLNTALLHSLNWLVRSKQMPRGMLPLLQKRLFARLTKEKDPIIRCNIIEILGNWREASDSVGLELLNRLNHLAMKSDLPALYKALARLAVQRPHIEEKVKRKLSSAYFHTDAAAALIRLTVAKNKGATDAHRQKELESTLNTIPRVSSDRSHCLKALLKAGVDDDIWDDDYHGVLVNATRAHLELQMNLSPDQSLLTDLLKQFEEALLSQNWPLRRFILAVVAACTEVMPIVVQHAYTGDLEMLLIKATIDAESFNSRRFALTALSYLRTATSAVVSALLAGCYDTEDVQQDTINAASRFQSIEGDLLPLLAEKIGGESVSRAYTAAHLLSALGGSAASEISDLRDQIIEAVVNALKSEESQREVVISGERKGKLEDVLYTTLLRVAGWMG